MLVLWLWLWLWLWGGAVARGGPDDTAFDGRHAGSRSTSTATPPTAAGFDEQRQWARAYWSALTPFHTSVYVSFLVEKGDARVRQAYGDAKYERLRALKREYDPTNVCHPNQNPADCSIRADMESADTPGAGRSPEAGTWRAREILVCGSHG